MKNGNQILRTKGFSLVEMMVSMSILSVLMLMLTVVLDQVQKSWRYSESRISQFREARVAFDLMTKNIGQASLNTYWGLEDKNDDGLFDGYYRTSELHFIALDADTLGSSPNQKPVGQGVFFQAPLGFSGQYRNLNNLFNGRGYFVAFGSDKKFKPSFVDSEDRYRFRLMEFRPPAEDNQIFEDGQDERKASEPQVFDQWYKQALSVGDGDFESHLNPIAENILTLVISPREGVSSASREATYSRIAPNYKYDSNAQDKGGAGADAFSANSQQVPPLVRVTMVAIDEAAAVRYSDSGGTMPAELMAPLSGLFKNTDSYDDDIQKLTDALNELKVSHKVFSSMVMLRSAKWSS
jgi:uncharacterized protein (TIGR02599 family)